jgi:hypothetical protein
MKTLLGCHKPNTRKTNSLLRKLRPFAEHWKAMEDDLEKMTVRQLNGILEACETPTDTNCWYATAYVAPIVRKMATEILSRRALKTKFKANLK